MTKRKPADNMANVRFLDSHFINGIMWRRPIDRIAVFTSLLANDNSLGFASTHGKKHEIMEYYSKKNRFLQGK